MLTSQFDGGSDTLNFNPKSKKHPLLSRVLAYRVQVVGEPSACMPIPGVLLPSIGLGTVPTSINHESVGSHSRPNINFPLKTLLRLAVHDIAAVVCLHDRVASRWYWRKDVMSDVVVESLNHLVQIPPLQKQVSFRTPDRFAWFDDAQYWICSAGAEIEKKASVIFGVIVIFDVNLRSRDMHRPIAAPCQRGNEPLTSSAIARKESGVTPPRFAARSRDSDGFASKRVKLPCSLVAPLLIFRGRNLKGSLFSDTLFLPRSVPKHPGPWRHGRYGGRFLARVCNLKPTNHH